MFFFSFGCLIYSQQCGEKANRLSISIVILNRHAWSLRQWMFQIKLQIKSTKEKKKKKKNVDMRIVWAYDHRSIDRFIRLITYFIHTCSSSSRRLNIVWNDIQSSGWCCHIVIIVLTFCVLEHTVRFATAWRLKIYRKSYRIDPVKIDLSRWWERARVCVCRYSLLFPSSIEFCHVSFR